MACRKHISDTLQYRLVRFSFVLTSFQCNPDVKHSAENGKQNEVQCFLRIFTKYLSSGTLNNSLVHNPIMIIKHLQFSQKLARYSPTASYMP